MTSPNNFTPSQELKIREVGERIERARERARLTIRQAAQRTVTSSRFGSITGATWRRVEKGYIQTGKGPIIYRPSAKTLVAIAEVVDLDPAPLCAELGLKMPPISKPQTRDARILEIRTVAALLNRLIDALG